MSVYGVGAYYGDDGDVTKNFIMEECFCIGYNKNEATTLYEMLRRAKIGDLVYIKSFTPRNNKVLYVKAIGFVIGRNIKEFTFDNGDSMGFGREIRWVKDFSDSFELIALNTEDKVNNVYSNTMYEEYSSQIIRNVIELLLK